VGAGLKTTLAAAMAIAALVMMMGCGGGEESSSAGDGSPTLSKAAFIKRAGIVCYRARKGAFERVAAYSNKHRSEGLPEAVLTKKAIRAGLISTFDAELAALRKLGAPDGEGEEVEAILASLQTSLDEAKEWKKKSFDEVEDYFVDADKKLQDYGLTRCKKK
jgi:hypothetical protein